MLEIGQYSIVFLAYMCSLTILSYYNSKFSYKALPNEILNRSTGKYVPYIFMEWANLRLNRHNTCDQYQEFLKSFTDNGYFPHKADSSLVPVTLETHVEWFDVIWIHKDALPIVAPKV